ncbi:MAG: putative metal-binding motif-containing protein, partial [Myxococcales bacterium]|nr:putative metal-binding motif-containing protein [Myxococcales bacterium]
MNFRWWLAAGAVALFALGCDDAGVGGSGDGGADADLDAEFVPDTEPTLDVAVRPDTGDAAPPPAGFGAPCSSGAQCLSGYCVPDSNDVRVCTERCRDECPDGWECRPVSNTRPDTVFICVTQREVQCRECQADNECGIGADRCLQIGAGKYCARDCSTEECPEGHVCSEVDVDGETLMQCLPEGGTCRPCQDEDGDGYGDGECLGIDCDDDDPTTYEGAPEICDGKDNDCNARADDDVGPPPDDFTCRQDGLCAGTAPACRGGDWTCPYPAGAGGESEPLCDGADDDCDGSVDENFDLQNDPAHCGDCATACAFEHAAPTCVEGACALGACEAGWWDVNGDAADGCEYPCRVSNEGVEICDATDNDCDGSTDDPFDLQADPSHRGAYNRACAFAHAAPGC